MASILKVDKLDPQSGTALELGTSGDTVSLPSGATLDISASTLTPPAIMPASSGINLTALNATNLGSGTVPTARLGTGTASSSTVLYGDQTYKAEPGGGKVLQVVSATGTTSTNCSTTDNAWSSTVVTLAITPTLSTSKILVYWRAAVNANNTDGITGFCLKTERAISGGATTFPSSLSEWGGSGNTHGNSYISESASDVNTLQTLMGLDDPGTASEITYTGYGAPYNLATTFAIGGPYNGRWAIILTEIDDS